jgi:hypothetical protein
MRRWMASSQSPTLISRSVTVLVHQHLSVALQVQDAAGNSTQFKIKTQTALKKLMATYCERAGLDFQVS